MSTDAKKTFQFYGKKEVSILRDVAKEKGVSVTTAKEAQARLKSELGIDRPAIGGIMAKMYLVKKPKRRSSSRRSRSGATIDVKKALKSLTGNQFTRKFTSTIQFDATGMGGTITFRLI